MSGSHPHPSNEHHVPRFADRHIGPDADAVATMLDVIGVESLSELAEKALPAGILDALSAGGIAPGLDHLPQAATETARQSAASKASNILVCRVMWFVPSSC